jgi:hypothetical protein
MRFDCAQPEKFQSQRSIQPKDSTFILCASIKLTLLPGMLRNIPSNLDLSTSLHRQATGSCRDPSSSHLLQSCSCSSSKTFPHHIHQSSPLILLKVEVYVSCYFSPFARHSVDCSYMVYGTSLIPSGWIDSVVSHNLNMAAPCQSTSKSQELAQQTRFESSTACGTRELRETG